MSQIEKINVPDPHSEVSSRIISEIVSAPEQWAAWNDALQQALYQSPDTQVTENIRLTAAVYAHSARAVDTLEEGRRTLALYRDAHARQDSKQDAGLAVKSVAAGYWRGLSGWFEKKLTSGDMNLKHSQARGDPMAALLDLPQALPQQIQKLKATIGLFTEQPALIPEVGHQLAENSAKMLAEKSKEVTLNALTAANPAGATAEMMGVFTAASVAELAMNVNPLSRTEKVAAALDGAVDAVHDVSRMDMQVLGKVMGEGSVPPVPPRLRDLSDREHCYLVKLTELIKFDYKPELTHLILGSVDTEIMQYMIRAGGDRAQSGYAKEMFLTMVETFKQNGVKVNRIDDHWPAWGAMTTNNHQFWHHVDKGESLENAAKKTFTGQRAAEIGLSEVYIPDEVRTIVSNNNRRESLALSFNRPQSSNPEIQSWYDYANAWRSSMGRPGIEVFKDSPGEKTDYMQNLTHPSHHDQRDAISNGLSGDDLGP